MEKETIYFISISVGVLIFVIILLQIIYIRIKLNHFEQDKSKDLTIVKAEPNFVNIYGVKINMEITKLMNNPGSKHFTKFQDFKGEYDTILPYVCENNIINSSVVLNRSGLLCLYPNDGAIKMADDCINNNLQYIVLNDIVLRISYNENVNDLIKEYCAKTFVLGEERIINDAIQSSFVFLLHSIYDHQVKDNTNKLDGCNFNVSSFIGEIKSIGFNKTIDLTTILGDTITTAHVIGYRI